MIKHKRIILIILILLINTNLYSTEDYGLYFKSYNVPADKRTSLILNNNIPFKIENEITINFKVLFREKYFGNIMDIITNNNNNFHLIIGTSDNIKYPTLFIYKNKIDTIQYDLQTNKWINVSLSFNNKSNNIKIKYDKFIKDINTNISNVTDILPIFGSTKHADIPHMNIKDIEVINNYKIIRKWKLSSYKDNICLDELYKVPAIAQNPYWLINDYIQWKEIYSEYSDTPLNVAFNGINSQFYIKGNNNIKIIDGNSGKEVKRILLQENPSLDFPGHLIFDTITNRLYSYSITENRSVYFSLNDNKWNTNHKLTKEPKLYNHARAYNEKDSSLYIIGGYGFYQYNNNIYKLNLNNNKISFIDYKLSIPPRCSASACILGDDLYIFGGYGNALGRQEFDSYNYHDFYKIDLKTGKSKKIWSKNIPNKSSVMASSMYFESSDSSFYAACMYNGGILYKVSLKDSTYTEISKPIYNNSVYQDLDFELYYSNNFQKFFLVIDKISNDKKHDLKIYSINKPLIKEEDIIQQLPVRNNTNLNIIIIIGSFIIITIAIIFFMYKKKKSSNDEIYNNDSNVDIIKTQDSAINTTNFIIQFKRDKASISLLGTFNVKDKNGNDITNNFTPRIKRLLLIIILYTQKNNKGILTSNILDIIWPDKEETSAKNNLNVNLRKLRLLLEEVGNIEIRNDNGFLNITWDNNVFCDYCTAISYINEYKKQEKNDETYINKIIELLLFGPLLSNTKDEWLDDFKENYSSLSIDLLTNLLSSKKYDQETSLHIIDIIFLHDPLNEEALSAKLSILFSQGKKGLATNAYNRFCKEYKELLGEEYKKSISDLCDKYVNFQF